MLYIPQVFDGHYKSVIMILNKVVNGHYKSVIMILNHYKLVIMILNHYKLVIMILNHYKSVIMILNHYKLVIMISNHYKSVIMILNHYKSVIMILYQVINGNNHAFKKFIILKHRAWKSGFASPYVNQFYAKCDSLQQIICHACESFKVVLLFQCATTCSSFNSSIQQFKLNCYKKLQ